jgi:hypothetical protein
MGRSRVLAFQLGAQATRRCEIGDNYPIGNAPAYDDSCLIAARRNEAQSSRTLVDMLDECNIKQAFSKQH